MLVGLTAIVFATGVALLLIGPSSRGTLLLVHKASFICWAVITAVHIAAHLPELARLNKVSRHTRTELNQLRSLIPGFGAAAEPPVGRPIPGSGGRWLSIGTALALGLVLAAILIPGLPRLDRRAAAVSPPPSPPLAETHPRSQQTSGRSGVGVDAAATSPGLVGGDRRRRDTRPRGGSLTPVAPTPAEHADGEEVGDGRHRQEHDATQPRRRRV